MIPIFPNDKRILNTWAPEMIYDRQKNEWVIFWSSTIKGDYPGTEGQVENEKNHRIYSMTTKDWKTFSDPKLFFDPGYPVIDATIFQDSDNYLMVFKDERRRPLHKQLRTAKSKSIYGPWQEISEPITENWTEGPSLIKLDGSFVIYFDAYKDQKKMKAIRSRDFKNWEKVSKGLEFPERYKHGSFLKISQKEANKLFN
jgi:beta-xylosidase